MKFYEIAQYLKVSSVLIGKIEYDMTFQSDFEIFELNNTTMCHYQKWQQLLVKFYYTVLLKEEFIVTVWINKTLLQL